jgi:hypothetical protein
MIRNYLTPEEFLAAFPLRSLTKTADLPAILGKAAAQVGQDLRIRGNRRRSFQVPIRFSGIDAFEIQTFSSSETSAGVLGYGASRFIVDCTTAPNSSATITLEGSNDEEPDADTTWFPVIGENDLPVSISVDQVWTYAVPFVTQAVTYRYNLTTTDSFSARVFLVDGATDQLIMLRALRNILFPLLDGVNERIHELHNRAVSDYDAEISRLVADYDTDDDQQIESGETDTRPRRRYVR